MQKAQAGWRESQNALEEVERTIRAAESAKAAAEANKTLAASTFKRYQALLERRSVSPQEFDEVKARYQMAEAEAERADRLLGSLQAKRDQALARIDQAKAEITSAEINAGYARIISPTSGVVTARQVEVGALSAPGTPLLTIEDDTHYRLEVAVEESRIRNIRLKTPARVLIAALGQEELTGTVAEVVPVADPASRSYTVKIALPPVGAAVRQILRSGLFGQARFTVGQREAITIPNKAVIQHGGLTSVYIVDASKIAHLRLIKTGAVDGERIEILSGLNKGELIVVEGAELVSEGSRVECDCEMTPPMN
jgi:RND family efflux transporter MFP subunit